MLVDGLPSQPLVLGLDLGQLFIIDFNTKLLVISSMPSAMDVSAIMFSPRSGSLL